MPHTKVFQSFSGKKQNFKETLSYNNADKNESSFNWNVVSAHKLFYWVQLYSDSP